jgi:hypothetical protein
LGDLGSGSIPDSTPDNSTNGFHQGEAPGAAPQPRAANAGLMKLGLEILKEVPHLLHLTFLTQNGTRLWAPVQPDYLTISSDALLMKFGAVIDGLWTVVGIVDGQIGEGPGPMKISPILDAAVSAMSKIREVIGRPKDHFGLTPIAIYAPMKGSAESEAEAGLSERHPES